MKYMNGHNLLLMLGNTVFAASKTCTLDIDCDTLEIAPPSNGSWKSFMADRKQWSVSAGHFVIGGDRLYNSLQEILSVGSSVTIKVQPCYEKKYYFEATLGSEVYVDTTSTPHDTWDKVYYSDQYRCFCVEYHGYYYSHWDDYRNDWSVFLTPEEGVTYIDKTTNKYYEWHNGGGTTPLSSIYKLQGNAICTKSKVTANNGSLVQGQFSFKGNGALTIAY